MSGAPAAPKKLKPNLKMDLLQLARKRLESILGNLIQDYFALLKQWICFKPPITQLQFDTAVRKLMTTDEQIDCHNQYIEALLNKASDGIDLTPSIHQINAFMRADYTENVPSVSVPHGRHPVAFEHRSAASELFLPDTTFISTRIAIHALENGLDDAEDGVAEVVVQACQTFIRNIIMAMLSRKRGYKVRDNKFQYGFGQAMPDPMVNNTKNVIDTADESKVEVAPDNDVFIPAILPSHEVQEQRAAFAYACAKRKYSDGLLTVQLLYDTLRENPHIVGLHSIHGINLLKVRLAADS